MELSLYGSSVSRDLYLIVYLIKFRAILAYIFKSGKSKKKKTKMQIVPTLMENSV